MALALAAFAGEVVAGTRRRAGRPKGLVEHEDHVENENPA